MPNFFWQKKKMPNLLYVHQDTSTCTVGIYMVHIRKISQNKQYNSPVSYTIVYRNFVGRKTLISSNENENSFFCWLSKNSLAKKKQKKSELSL